MNDTNHTIYEAPSLQVSPGEQVCAPDCSGVDPGVRVRDPTDFTKYYICLDVDGSGKYSFICEMMYTFTRCYHLKSISIM